MLNTKIEIFPDKINKTGTESNPYISNDGSYLIFLRSGSSGFGDSDLYISFKTISGGWTEPENLPPLFPQEIKSCILPGFKEGSLPLKIFISTEILTSCLKN